MHSKEAHLVEFKLNNCKTDTYITSYKPFQLTATVYGKAGAKHGFVSQISALVDSGAKNTLLGKSVMKRILTKVKDERGSTLKPQGYVSSQGVYGDAVTLPWYIIPNLCLFGATPTAGIRLTNVAIIASNSDNMECLIGRSILHQCILTLDPESDVMYFDFKDSLKPNKQTFGNAAVFEDVSFICRVLAI
jgi:hypothetical protein